MTSTIPEISIETRMLIDRLKTAQIGETITYATLSNIIGREVQDDARHLLVSAQKACLRDHIVFASVRKIGVKRLADTEIVGIGEAMLPKIKRAAKRGIVKMTSVADFSALPDAAKLRHNAVISMLGVVAHVAGPRRLQKITDEVTKAAGSQLPPAKLLEAFRAK